MPTEFASVAIIVAVCCLALTLLDLAVVALLTWLLHLSFKKFFLYGLLTLLLPLLLIGYGIFIERNIFYVKRVEITLPTLPESFDGYRIVHLSDIHSRSFRHRHRALARCVERVNGLNPDLIAFTGDIVTLNSAELADTRPILSRLHARHGVVSVIGNHDYCTYGHEPDGLQQVVSLERGMGWQVLCNDHIILHQGTDSLAVVGVENISASRHFPTTGNLAQALKGTRGMFVLLLSHDPTHWEGEVVGTDIPLMLSGHTHAAQTSLLGWTPARYFYNQYKGLYEKMGQHLYINQGLGETIFPARIGAPPEITLITLRKH